MYLYGQVFAVGFMLTVKAVSVLLDCKEFCWEIRNFLKISMEKLDLTAILGEFHHKTKYLGKGDRNSPRFIAKIRKFAEYDKY